MKTNKTLLLTIPFLILGSCGANYDRSSYPQHTVSSVENYQEENKMAKESSSLKDEIELNETLDVKQSVLKIIKNADAKFLVTNVDSATNEMMLLARKYQGYISDMKFNQNTYKIENSISVSIPSVYFERFLSKSTSLAKHVDYNNITSQDVTEEFIDLENRIKVKEEVKARYEHILRTKAKSLDEVLRAERQIQLIQEEIESAKGRVKYINTKSAMSTIQLKLYEQVDFKEKPTAYNKTFGSKFKEGLKAGWKVIESIVLIIIYAWPLVIALIIGWFFLIKRIRKQKTK